MTRCNVTMGTRVSVHFSFCLVSATADLLTFVPVVQVLPQMHNQSGVISYIEKSHKNLHSMETLTDRQWNSGVVTRVYVSMCKKERDSPSLVFTYKTHKLHISGILAPSTRVRCDAALLLELLHMAEVGKMPGHLERETDRIVKSAFFFFFLPPVFLVPKVTAWSAISSSPRATASCGRCRRPARPPVPRTASGGAGGPCSTWPRPAVTSAGRGR